MHPDAHGSLLQTDASIATALAPALRDHCRGRLGPIEWFQCAWQTSGAATGFSTWTFDDGRRAQALVKIPVGPVEHRWTTLLGAVEPAAWDEPSSHALPTPRVLAGGLEIGGHDLGWIITERLEGSPLSQSLTPEALAHLIDAAADFQSACLSRRPDVDEAPRHDWDRHVGKARDAVKAASHPDAQRWNEALKRVHRAMPMLLREWDGRSTSHWCHGDLHPGNALRRPTPSGGSPPSRGCVLIDLALVHPGHWVEDAVYLERQFWGHADRLHGVKPVSALAAARRARGLPTDPRYPEIAVARRVLIASVVPLFLDREHNAKYTRAALEVIEKYLPQVH